MSYSSIKFWHEGEKKNEVHSEIYSQGFWQANASKINFAEITKNSWWLLPLIKVLKF